MNRFLRSCVPRLLSCSNLEAKRYRNVWISGLIDPSKTTLSERERLYLRRESIREEEERNQVISSLVIKKNIQSAITFLDWKTEEEEKYKLTLMDTSDSLVDFTFDVETALRAFDSAILVLSCVNGVKTNSIKIDQQITRFNLPRLIYINNILDQSILVDQVKSKLHHHCAAIQVKIYSLCHWWLVDLVKLESYCDYEFVGENHGEEEVDNVDEYMKTRALEKRRQLIEIVSEVDDKLAEAFRSGNDDISASDLDDAIRRATIARKFVPIFMGCTAEHVFGIKQFGIKQLLDGVVRYLPSPIDVSNYALDLTKNGEKVGLCASIDEPFVALAFTMEHKRLCSKLTYLRVYQGVIGFGDFITNVNTGKKIQVPPLFQKHSTYIDDIYRAEVGEIVALLDVDSAPGDTFTDGSVRYTMTQ